AALRGRASVMAAVPLWCNSGTVKRVRGSRQQAAGIRVSQLDLTDGGTNLPAACCLLPAACCLLPAACPLAPRPSPLAPLSASHDQGSDHRRGACGGDGGGPLATVRLRGRGLAGRGGAGASLSAAAAVEGL